MKPIPRIAKYRPSDAFWLVATLLALGLAVAAPASAWVGLEAALYAGID
jgi:hypothetical protein